jgi:hypothetical protein
MPHDLNGDELKPGDRVLMEFRVKSVHATEELCNVDLESVQPFYPHRDQYTTLSAVNTRQVRKA